MAKRPTSQKSGENKSRKDLWSVFFTPASDTDDLFASGDDETEEGGFDLFSDAEHTDGDGADVEEEPAEAPARRAKPSPLDKLRALTQKRTEESEDTQASADQRGRSARGKAKAPEAAAEEPFEEIAPLRAGAGGVHAAGTRIAYHPRAKQAEATEDEPAFTEPPEEYTGEAVLPAALLPEDGEPEEESPSLAPWPEETAEDEPAFTEPPEEYTGKPLAPIARAEGDEAPSEPDKPEAEALFTRMDGEAEESEPEIRLFDDEEEEKSFLTGSTGRTRLVKTGKKTAARVQVNRTGSQKRMEDAARALRAKEAEEQHVRYVQKQKKRANRKKTLWEHAGNISFTVFLIAAVLVALYYAFLLSDVVIAGNEDYSDDYILQRSGLEMGKHMLLVDLDAVEANISEDPYLQVDSVTYIFPSRVRIAVTERKEVAGIIGLDYNVIIDHNGYVLSMGGGTDLSDLLQVTGISMTGFQLGQRLGDGTDFGTATLISMIGKLEEYTLLDSIQSMDLTKPLAITMKAKNGLNIFVGQPTDLDGKMLSLYRELPQFIKQGISTGTLYLSAKGGTVYSQTDTAQLILDAELNPVLPDEGGGTGGNGDNGTGSAAPGTGTGTGGAGTGSATPGTGTGGAGTGTPDDFQG